jgi:hypothetical protein
MELPRRPGRLTESQAAVELMWQALRRWREQQEKEEKPPR